jgi:hypothetical protein
MGGPVPLQRSGNSLSRKAWKWREKWGGPPCDCRTVSSGTWRKTVFSIVAGESSPDTVGSLKKKKKKKKRKGNHNFVFHQNAPHVDVRWITLIFSNILRIFTSPCTATLPVECSTHTRNVLSKKNTSCRCRSPLQCGKADGDLDLDKSERKNWESYNTKWASA